MFENRSSQTAPVTSAWTLFSVAATWPTCMQSIADFLPSPWVTPALYVRNIASLQIFWSYFKFAELDIIDYNHKFIYFDFKFCKEIIALIELKITYLCACSVQAFKYDMYDLGHDSSDWNDSYCCRTTGEQFFTLADHWIFQFSKVGCVEYRAFINLFCLSSYNEVHRENIALHCNKSS